MPLEHVIEGELATAAAYVAMEPASWLVLVVVQHEGGRALAADRVALEPKEVASLFDDTRLAD
jgi:hypothetical protein